MEFIHPITAIILGLILTYVGMQIEKQVEQYRIAKLILNSPTRTPEGIAQYFADRYTAATRSNSISSNLLLFEGIAHGIVGCINLVAILVGLFMWFTATSTFEIQVSAVVLGASSICLFIYRLLVLLYTQVCYWIIGRYGAETGRYMREMCK